MPTDHINSDPSNWDPALDAVIAAPANHRVVYENDRLRVLEVTLEAGAEEPMHHHRWPSVFVLDPRSDPSLRTGWDDVAQAKEGWDGRGCLVVNMTPQPPTRVLNASGKALHGIRVEMKT